VPRKDPEASREYQREYQRKWYQRNRALQMARVTPGNRRAREAINKYVDQVKSRSCADCGGHFPPFMMDFDHVRGEKTADISRLRGTRASRARLQAELAKCEVVCANCHRRRTQIRMSRCEVALLGNRPAAHACYLQAPESALRINLRPRLHSLTCKLAELLLARPTPSSVHIA
jgi:hypothetical protein